MADLAAQKIFKIIKNREKQHHPKSWHEPDGLLDTKLLRWSKTEKIFCRG